VKIFFLKIRLTGDCETSFLKFKSMSLHHHFSFSDSNAQNVISQALYLGNPSVFNTTRDDCKWKHGNERDICPDPDILITLYTSVKGKNRGKLLVSNFNYYF
jgi:hypothetical protein